MLRFFRCLLLCCGVRREAVPEGEAVTTDLPLGCTKVEKGDEEILITYIDDGRQSVKTTWLLGEVERKTDVMTAAYMEDTEKRRESIKGTDCSSEVEEEDEGMSITAVEDTEKSMDSVEATIGSEQVEDEADVTPVTVTEDMEMCLELVKTTVCSAEMAAPDGAASLDVDPDAAPSTAAHTCARLPPHLGRGLIIVTGPPRIRPFSRSP